MQRAYATTFTAAELAFVAEYSNSEIGKRVQRKMPGYVAKVPLLLLTCLRFCRGSRSFGIPYVHTQMR